MRPLPSLSIGKSTIGLPFSPVPAAIDSRPAKSQGEGPFFNQFRGLGTVAKPELGTKRLCAGCGAKFYDLNKTPPTCPSCGTVFEVVPVVTRPRPDAARAA